MGEGQKPIGAGDEQDEENAEPDGGIGGKKCEHQRHNRRYNDEIAKEKRGKKTKVAQPVQQATERDLQKVA